VNLAEVNLPQCADILSAPFAYCTALSVAHIPKCENIGSYAFIGCENLTRIELTQVSSVTYIDDGLSPFQGTPFAADPPYGSIYVPASLYAAFVNDYHWDAVSNLIVSVGSSPSYDGSTNVSGTTLVVNGGTVSGTTLMIGSGRVSNGTLNV
jgi:hypothetical protein